MVNQDQTKQERLLRLAGWLHDRHNGATRAVGQSYTEVRFTREDLGRSSALAMYAMERGDTGQRALGRDVGDLKTFGIDVRWVPADKAWVSRAEQLTDEECRALAAAALSVIVEDGSMSYDGFHIPGVGLSVEGAEMVVAYAPIIDVLIDAIRSRTAVEILHRGRERTVDPWQVVMTDGRWFLVGRDHDADSERIFLLDAVDSVRIVGSKGAYEIPKLDEGRLGRRAGDPDEWTSSDPVDVDLEVDRRLVPRAVQLLGADVLETRGSTDDWVLMRCEVRNVGVFIDRLFGLRARAVVTGPSWVRERVIAALEEMV